MGLIEDLGADAIALDTAILIYFIEEEPRFSSLIAPLFHAADQGRMALAVSALTLLEVLVVPYRASNQTLIRRYDELLTRGRGIRTIDLTHDVLHMAARLRATTGVRTPDALQLGCALIAGCATFLTNDRKLPPVPGLRIVQLSSYAR